MQWVKSGLLYHLDTYYVVSSKQYMYVAVNICNSVDNGW